MRWAAGVRGRSSSHQGSHAQYLQSTWAHRNTTEAQSTEKIPHNVQIITLALFSEVKPQCFPNQTDHKTKVRRAWRWCTAEVGLLWISDIYSYDIAVASSSSFTQSVDVCLERVHDILWFSWCPGRNEGKPGQFSLTTSKTTSTKQGQHVTWAQPAAGTHWRCKAADVHFVMPVTGRSFWCPREKLLDLVHEEKMTKSGGEGNDSVNEGTGTENETGHCW